MAVEIALAQRHGPFSGTLDPDTIAAYATATNDTNPLVLSGEAVPVTFPVILIFDAQWAANAAVPKEVYASGRNGVHGEHEVLLHRPLVVGETLETFSEPFAVRNTRAGARVVLHMEQFGADGGLAAEHWWTIFFPGACLAMVVLAIAGGHDVDSFESNGKKIAFQREVIRRTGCKARCFQLRLESLVAETLPRSVDYVVSRALAPLSRLLEYASPFLERGAKAYFHKGQDVDMELTEATKYWKLDFSRHASICDSRGNTAVGTNSTARALFISQTGRARISQLYTDVNTAIASTGACP